MAKNTMIHGKTKSGFEFSVDPDAVKDMEFIELAAEAENNGLILPKMIEYILGSKQKKALYDHVRNEKGRVMIEDINDEITQIFDSLNTNAETKN
jgi:hypothetical protein